MADQTVGELFKSKAITDADLRAAVDAYLADPTTDLFVMGDYSLNLAEAVRAHQPALRAMEDGASEAHKREVVRSAFVLARVKG